MGDGDWRDWGTFRWQSPEDAGIIVLGKEKEKEKEAKKKKIKPRGHEGKDCCTIIFNEGCMKKVMVDRLD